MRHKAASAALAGTLAVLPAVAATGGAANWVNLASVQNIGEVPGNSDVLALQGGYDTGLTPVAVNGSLPDAAQPQTLPAYELPEPSVGPLGIPDSALKAYRKAAERMAAEQPGCGIDWALIASIGRIESNHARGGYVDANGTTRERILGPVLNGVGPVAAIHDTDGGRHDGDTVWDRAVGPTQFIPSTWIHYAADGNDDGNADPNNIYDAALASARYLCSGGFDLTDPDQLRAAIYRYNHSDTYVNTVILWAQAYRDGVTPTPDSTVPTGTPHNTTTTGAPDPAPAPSSSSAPKAPQSSAQPRSDTPSTKPGTKLPPEVKPPSSSEPPPSTLPPSDNEPSPPTGSPSTPPPTDEEPPKTCEPVKLDPETGEPVTEEPPPASGEEPGDLPPCDKDTDGDGIADELSEEPPSEQPSGTEGNPEGDETESATGTPTT